MREKHQDRSTGEYEKPTIKRHAVVMTMAPAGSKMGHGIFPFVSKPDVRDQETTNSQKKPGKGRVPK